MIIIKDSYENIEVVIAQNMKYSRFACNFNIREHLITILLLK